MKKECKNCANFRDGVCTKNQKNGYFNCSKFKQIPISEFIKERNLLLISKSDPARLEFLTEKISEINGGII